MDALARHTAREEDFIWVKTADQDADKMVVATMSYTGVIPDGEGLLMIIADLKTVMGSWAPAGYSKRTPIFIGHMCKIVS